MNNGMTKLSAAWIIDHVLHMRGVHEGHVGTWDAQALVLVTDMHASAHEVHEFAMQVIDACASQINIFLEPEVVFVGMKKK
jgi:UDP-N-acetylmuramate dehydrogenase